MHDLRLILRHFMLMYCSVPWYLDLENSRDLAVSRDHLPSSNQNRTRACLRSPSMLAVVARSQLQGQTKRPTSMDLLDLQEVSFCKISQGNVPGNSPRALFFKFCICFLKCRSVSSLHQRMASTTWLPLSRLLALSSNISLPSAFLKALGLFQSVVRHVYDLEHMSLLSIE